MRCRAWITKSSPETPWAKGPLRCVREWRRRASGANAEHAPLYSNADMGPAEVRQYCDLDAAGRSLTEAAMQQLGLSARVYHRVLKLARTIADLARSERIQVQHLAEALQYRPRQWERGDLQGARPALSTRS